MTLSGTNSYAIDAGRGEAVVIDPGPDIERHVDALIENTRGRGLRITAIGITHGHPDHAPAARTLAAKTGATVYAHPRSNVPHDCDLPLEQELRIAELSLRVVDAPGHTFDHVVFYEPQERVLFTGDVILGEGTVVIAPPGGAMRPYQRTLQRLANEFPEAAQILGGHGPRVDDPPAKIAEYIEHRRMREMELRRALATGPKTIPQLVLAIYGDDRPILRSAMARQMLAYLDALIDEDAVTATAAGRPMTLAEAAMLNPAWETIVGPDHAPLVEAELGSMLHLDTLYVYSLFCHPERRREAP
jgi:glyoxylase-like metal-dependent hydrolase (beta-lactamase superfamily II)